MTPDDMEQLRRLALAAQEAMPSWSTQLEAVLLASDDPVANAVGRFINAANPARVIELLDRVEKAEAALALSHENRTKESVHYANLCAEIIESTGYKSGGGVTAIEACAWVRTRAEAAEARVAVLEAALRRIATFAAESRADVMLRPALGDIAIAASRAALTGSATPAAEGK